MLKDSVPNLWRERSSFLFGLPDGDWRAARGLRRDGRASSWRIDRWMGSGTPADWCWASACHAGRTSTFGRTMSRFADWCMMMMRGLSLRGAVVVTFGDEDTCGERRRRADHQDRTGEGSPRPGVLQVWGEPCAYA